MRPMFDVDLAVFDHGVPKDVYFRLEMVTPDRARELLALNTGNRPVREKWVVDIAEDMKDGEWDFTAAPLRVNSNNVFDDGQHRLLGIIRTGIPQPMLIAYNLTPESGDNVDQLAARTVSNILHRRGTELSNSVTVAAMALLLFAPGNRGIKKRKIANYVEEHEEDLSRWGRWAHIAARHSSKVAIGPTTHHLLQAAPLGALAVHLTWADVHPDFILEFFNGLALLGPQMPRDITTELPEERYRSLQSVHTYLTNSGPLSRSGGSAPGPLFQMFATLIHNFNNYITGHQIQMVKNVHNWGRSDDGKWILPRSWNQMPGLAKPTIEPMMGLVKAIEW